MAAVQGRDGTLPNPQGRAPRLPTLLGSSAGSHHTAVEQQVARWAHNPEVAGSNPARGTTREDDGMDELLAFVRARLDEDEAAASAASDGPWTPWRTSRLHGTGQLRHVVALPGQKPGAHAAIATASWMDSEHIARHDPARVLRQVAAGRGLLRELSVAEHTLRTAGRGTPPHDIMTGAVNSLRNAARHLATTYAGHPDYRDEWRL